MKNSTKINIVRLASTMDSFYFAKQSSFVHDAKIASDKYGIKNDYLSCIHSGYLDFKGMARKLAEELTIEEFQELNEYVQLRYEESRLDIEAEYKLICLLSH